MNWNETTIAETVEKQRAYFKTGKTLDINWRLEQLNKLKAAMGNYEAKLIAALNEDLGRSEMEGYLCDIGTVILEVNEIIKGLRKWARPEKHYSGIMAFPSTVTKVYKMPYGVSLIISPFNFPILLTFGVMAASIAAGNTCIIKASSKSPACTKVLQEIVSDTYSPDYVTVIDGGHDVADMCLAQRFDKIFYTGSPKVGRHVLEEAAVNLTPVTLELGGETGNWAIVRKDADLKDAARKIACIKLFNSGQICINVNQVAVAEEVAEEFTEELKKAYKKQIGKDPLSSNEYPKLINVTAYDKCADEAEEYRDRIIYGGNGDKTSLKYEPTIIYPVTINENIVMHELFSPLLPIVPFNDENIDELLSVIADREHGLALYLFTKDKVWAEKVMQTQQYGGGCVNEVMMHLVVKGVPFNGTGHSGMGAYHGEWGFREFTHPSTVLYGKTHFNLSLREHPFTNRKFKLIKKFEK